MDISKPPFWTFRFPGAQEAAFDEKVFLSPHVENHFLRVYVCVCAQSCPTLCNPMNSSTPSSSVHGIFQQEVWSGLPFPPPGDLPDPGMETESPTLAGGFFITEPPWEPHFDITVSLNNKSSIGTPIRVPSATTVYILRLQFMKMHLSLCSVAR